MAGLLVNLGVEKFFFVSGVRLDIETYKESGHAAYGNGSGIVIVARTSTGCILGTRSGLCHIFFTLRQRDRIEAKQCCGASGVGMRMMMCVYKMIYTVPVHAFALVNAFL